MQAHSATAYGKEPLGAQTLWEMYESDELFNEGIVSFEYPLYYATDEEMDYFLGKLVKAYLSRGLRCCQSRRKHCQGHWPRRERH